MSTEDVIRRVTIDDIDIVKYEDPAHMSPYLETRRLFSGPDVMQITFPPNTRLEHHAHPADTLYIFQAGEFHIEGEDVYHAGDIRWVKGGFAYGPEWSGAEGATFLIVAVSGPHGITWDE